MTVLVNFLENLRVGEPRTFENLTVFPLIGMQLQEPGYLLLDEALVHGLIEVREVSETGSVNEVLVINQSDLPVLLMDGEILTGAKQNRVVNASILVAAHSVLKIPVSCVEQGRWRYVDEKFTDSRRFSYSKLRAQKSEQVCYSLAYDGTFKADQEAIWDEVLRKQVEMGADSPTSAVNSIYESYEEKLKKYCEAFSPLEGQVGAAVFINGRFVCLDAFDSSVTLYKLYKKLIESYALDALEQAGRDGKKEPEEKTAKMLLEKIAAARVLPYPSMGLGQDLRIKTKGLTGSCLALDGRVIHLAVFARLSRESRGSGPLSRPSRRGRQVRQRQQEAE